MAAVRIATRQSKLALWQANFIAAELQRHHSGLEVELVGITTRGDKWLSSPLSEVGGKGLFVKELEAAMLDGRADLAVHSMKDLPALLPDGFSLPVIGFRAPVQDVLIGVTDLDQLASGARIGSSSLRRKAQLLALRRDLDVTPVRGNVDTRLAKLDAGEFDAIVLAQAGLQRLEIERDDCLELSVEQSLPAPGQGALGIEVADGNGVLELLQPLHDVDVERAVRAERGISAGLGADCSLPVAALCTADDAGNLDLNALIANADGTRVLRASAAGDDPDAIAARAVASLLEQGAADILAELSD